jgi:putative SOS response-associated peptidase YedK
MLFGTVQSMCGRFNVIDNPGLQQLLHDLGIDLSLPQRVNVAPTESIELVRQGESGLQPAGGSRPHGPRR